MITTTGKNLVFICGVPRSGTTLLSLLLGSHSDVFCPPEPWFLLKLSTVLTPGHYKNKFDDTCATIAANKFLPKEIFIEASRSFAVTAYNSYLKKHNKQLFVDKTPRYYFILQDIAELFPDARFVWIKRNPLDVALSYKKSWDFDLEKKLERNFNFNSFDFLQGFFLLHNFFSVPSGGKFLLQYEDMVKQPSRVLRDICSFLNIPYEKNIIDYASNKKNLHMHFKSPVGDEKALTEPAIHTKSVGNWSNELTSGEIRKLIGVLGSDIFIRMGYEDTVSYLKNKDFIFPSQKHAHDLRKKLISSCNNSFLSQNALIQEISMAMDDGNFSSALTLTDLVLENCNGSDLNLLKFRKASILKNLKRFNEALSLLDAIIKEDPRYEFRKFSGEVYAASGRHDKALEIFYSLCDEYPDGKNLFIHIHDTLINAGRVEEGLKILSRINISDYKQFNNNDLCLQKVLALKKLKRYKDALEFLNSLLKIHPHDYDLNLLKGGVLAAAGDYDASVNLFYRLLKGHPYNTDLYLNISDVFRYASRYDKALQTLKKLGSVSPSCKKLFYKTGQVYHEMGVYRKAIINFIKEYKTSGDYEMLPLIKFDLQLISKNRLCKYIPETSKLSEKNQLKAQPERSEKLVAPQSILEHQQGEETWTP